MRDVFDTFGDSDDKWEASDYNGYYKLTWIGKPFTDSLKEIYSKVKEHIDFRNFHRLDGPAVVYSVPHDSRNEYWIDGKQLTKEEFEVLTKVVDSNDKTITTDLTNI